MANTYTEEHAEAYDHSVGLIPANYAVGVYTTAYIPVNDYHRVVAVLRTGAMGQAATVDAVLMQATDALGTGAVVVGAKAGGNKAIVQLNQALGDGNDICLIECQMEELDVDNQYDHVALTVTVANAAVDLDAFIMRFQARFEPVPNTAVSQIID